MTHFTEHFSGTVRTTKDDLRYGPMKWRRVPTMPAATYGRNGDYALIDDTADESEETAINRIPTDVSFCQKMPIPVTAGDFTITAVSGVYTITIATLDDFVSEVTQADIPELRVEFTDPKSPGGGINFLLHANSVSFADGTSDLPSKLGITGLQNGDVVVPNGVWECFDMAGIGVFAQSSGVPVGTAAFDTINFTGAGVSSVIDSGGGVVTVTVAAPAGAVSYGTIVGDTGSTTATVLSETITYGGIGVSINATNLGTNFDTISFDLDIADLPAGAGPLVPTDELAVNDGGTTERHSIEDVVEAVLPGLTIEVINGQPMLTLADTTRVPKVLSIAEQVLVWSENQLNNLDWIQVGTTADIDSGYIMDFDGTVVYATAHCEGTGANSKDVHLFINGVDQGSIGTLSGGINATFSNALLNLDFTQGAKLRLQVMDGGAPSGAIGDTIVKLTVKWRKA